MSERPEQEPDWIEPELRAVFDAHAPAQARPEFRAVLQRRFLAGELSEEASDEVPDPALAAGLDAVHTPPARPAFRDALREAFLNAPVEETVADADSRPTTATPHAAPAPSRPAEHPAPHADDDVPAARPIRTARRPRTTAPRPATGSRQRFQLLVGGLVAAAAVVLAVLRPWEATSDPGNGLVADGGAFVDHWFVEPSYIPGEVLVDGVRLAADIDPAEMSRRIANASTVSTAGTNLRLQYGSWFVIGIDADSSIDLTGIPEDPNEGTFRLTADTGGFQVRTGPAFKTDGRALAFATPETEVDVVGTTFGINCIPDMGTCVCCAEGRVQVRPASADHDPHAVDADAMSFVFEDTTHEPMLGGLYPDHAEGLEIIAEYAFRDCP